MVTDNFSLTETQELIRTHGLRISELVIGHSMPSSASIIERARRIIELAESLPEIGAEHRR